MNIKSLILILLIISFILKPALGDEQPKVDHQLTFNIRYIEISPPFVIIGRTSPEEARIFFNNSSYSDGSVIPYSKGSYELGVWLRGDFLFLSWYSSNDIIIEDRFQQNTRAILTGKVDYVLQSITNVQLVSQITLLVLKNSTNFYFNFYNNGFYIGNLTYNSIYINNKVNNKTSFKFLPFENIKIFNKIKFKANKPYANNPNNAHTFISALNYIINDDSLLKKEKNKLEPIRILNQNIIKQYMGLLDVDEDIKFAYPNETYQLGFSNRVGQTFIISSSFVNITWSWYEKYGNQYAYKRVTKYLYGVNASLAYVSNAFLKLDKFITLGDEVLLRFKAIWLDDLNEVKNKSNILATYLKDIGISLGTSDDQGNIEISINRTLLDGYFLGLYGKFNFALQFKNNATIDKSPISLIRWSKLATVVLYRNSETLKLKIIRLDDLTPVSNVTVKLIIDDKVVQSKFSDEKGEVFFHLANLNYNKMEVRVNVEEYSDIALSSEISNITIDSRIWP